MNDIKSLAERLAWMTINGKPDMDQWENTLTAWIRQAQASDLESARAEARREVIEKAKQTFRNEHDTTHTRGWNLKTIIYTLDTVAEGREP